MSTSAQINFLLDLAWERCGITQDELSDYETRFEAMTVNQAGDLISTWSALPKVEFTDRPTAQQVPTPNPVTTMPPAVQPRQMPAKYVSVCPICNNQIFVGAPIYYVKGLKATHQACGVPTAGPIQIPSPVTLSQANSTQRTNPVGGTWDCDKCAMKFASRQERDNHMPTHIVQPPQAFANGFECSECGSRFSSAQSRNNHEAVAHNHQPTVVVPALPPIKLPAPGYYAAEIPIEGVMTMRFYRVTQRPRNSGRFIFMRQSGDNFVWIEDAEKRMAAALINAAPILAMEMYGKLLGRCGCCRKSLTDPDSIARGIGPECIKRYRGMF